MAFGELHARGHTFEVESSAPERRLDVLRLRTLNHPYYLSGGEAQSSLFGIPLGPSPSMHGFLPTVLRVWGHCLEHDEVLFSVMHDAIRPLNVAAAGTPSRALGTVFNVEMRSTKVTVSVLEGAVKSPHRNL